jgi:hypothetical protein
LSAHGVDDYIELAIAEFSSQAFIQWLLLSVIEDPVSSKALD